MYFKKLLSRFANISRFNTYTFEKNLNRQQRAYKHALQLYFKDKYWVCCNYFRFQEVISKHERLTDKETDITLSKY